MEVARITATPAKDSHAPRSKFTEIPKSSENSNPNLPHSSSPPLTKSLKSATRNHPAVFSPRKKIRDRKFVVARKASKKEKPDSKAAAAAGVECKCNENSGGGEKKKCICAAYESLRASQEEYFLKTKQQMMENLEPDCCDKAEDDDDGGALADSPEIQRPFDTANSGERRTSIIKRRRERMLEEARNSVPECGKVLHLVKAFEKLLTVPGPKESEPEECKKPVMWALPGLQHTKVVPHPETHTLTQLSCSSFSPSDFMLTAEKLGLDDAHLATSSSWDSSHGRSSDCGGRSRRNSSDSVGTVGGRRWKKKQQMKITSQKPFKLITEQRGRAKEEEFVKKVQEMMVEQEKQRIPIAQGLPYTTDEPEVLIKPPVKEITKPIDLRLHTDQRAVERAEFDNQVHEKLSLIEQYKMERERQQKLEEEEEIRRLRKELVPKAQPMPYFDRPFIPKRSVKNPTIPKEPKFHIPNHKKIKCCLSWNDDMCSFTLQDQSSGASLHS